MAQRWAVICKACHGPAFVVVGALPKPSDVVTAAACEHLDGRKLNADELMCDTCGTNFALSGVEPSTEWRLLAEPLVAESHNRQDAPFGTQADARDIAAVRLVLSAVATPPRPQRRRRAVS